MDILTFKDAVEELGKFLDTRIKDVNEQAKLMKSDAIVNVHLVGQEFAYRETRCFLEHLVTSLTKDKK